MKIYPVPERTVKGKDDADVVLPARTVRCPHTGREIVAVFENGKEVGTEVPDNDAFWLRRLADGDVSAEPLSPVPVPEVAQIEAQPAVQASAQPKASSKEVKAAEKGAE